MELTQARRLIDETDEKITALFKRRMDLSAEIAAYKQAHGMDTYDPSREEEKLKSIAKTVNPDLLPYVLELYSKIFELSRAYQREIREK